METSAELTQLLHAMMPFTKELGLEAVSGDENQVVTVAQHDPKYCTAGDVIHGGFLMAIADATGATLAVYNLPEGAITSTIESKTNFFRPHTAGEMKVTSTLVHAGRSTIVVQTDITNPDGKLITRTTQTQAIKTT